MTTPSQPSELELREARAYALQRSAIRQTATLRAACAAVSYAPTLDDCAAAIERARDELEHLERSAEEYRELHDAELTDAIADQVAQLPLPTSWFEAALAQLVLCLAARIEATSDMDGPVAASALRVVRECEHVDAARAAVRELRVSHPRQVPAERVDRWLQIALDSLSDEHRATYLAALLGDASALGVELPATSIAAA
ncbi:MAG TPA: hypothetical protein VI299_03325 [Polyangiales bacterium]